MIARADDDGRLTVLGTGQRESRGVKRGYITDMAASEFAVREAVELAERMSGVTVEDVWASYGAGGLVSDVANVEVELGGHPVEQSDIDELLERRQERDRPQRPGRAPRPSGALHDRPRAGRPAADRPPRQPPRRRHPRHRRRPVAAAQHRHRDPLGAPRRQSDRRLADRRRARLPQRGGARARRRAGRARRRSHQRLGPFRRDARRAALDPARRARTSPTTSPAPSRSSAATPSGSNASTARR